MGRTERAVIKGWHRLTPALPIPLLLAIILLLWAGYFRTTYESPYLLLGLNFVFSTLTSLFIAYLIARSFLVRSAPGLLMLGCGVLIWGGAGLVGAAVGIVDAASGQEFANITVTIHNSSAWLSALCHLVGAGLSRRPRRIIHAAGLWLAIGYTAAVGGLAVVTLSTLSGWMPTFFLQGLGGTPVRQFVLGWAVIMFALTAPLLLKGRNRSWSPFTYWYALALLLIAAGLFGVMVEPSMGSISSWVGRAAQYLGGLYMLTAAIASVRESRALGITLEGALRASEERYKALFETMTEGFALQEIIRDEAGKPCDFRVVAVNPAFERQTGLKAKDILGRTVFELFPQVEPVWFERFCKVAVTGEPARFEEWFGPLGRWFQVSSFRTEPGRLGVVFTDVSKHRQIEEALEATARKFSVMFATTSDGIWIHNLQGEILEVNDAYCSMSGYSREELTGASVSMLEANESPEEILEQLRKVLDGGGHDRFESRHRRKDGSLCDVDITALHLNIDGGRIAIFVRNITERKRAEAALRESRNKYQALIETTNDFIWEMDALGRYTYCSPQMEKLWGIKPELMIGKTPFDVMPAEQRDSAAASFAGLALTPQPFSGLESAAHDGHGRLIYIETSGVPFFDDHGRLLGFRGISRDITERRQAEERMAQLYAEARQEIAGRERLELELRRSNADLEQFASAISHDLRSPLNAVTSFAQQLDEEFHAQLGPQADTYLQYITGATQRMRRLINDLLTYSRVAGIEEGRLGPKDSQEALREAELNLQEKAREAGATITHDRLPEVLAGSGLLARVFQNLLENAIKFRGEDSPRVHVRAEPHGEDWLFCVSDNGIGIDPQHSEQVFRIFKRLHGDTYEGTGIGLALCKKIVERLGGRIWVESASGQGAKFYFTLRAAESSRHASSSGA